jgi:voltage-gated potassium channel
LNKNQTEVYSYLSNGGYFGEIALIKDIPRTATVKALSYCDLYFLDRLSFDNIIKRYPGIISKIEERISQIERERDILQEINNQ